MCNSAASNYAIKPKTEKACFVGWKETGESTLLPCKCLGRALWDLPVSNPGRGSGCWGCSTLCSQLLVFIFTCGILWPLGAEINSRLLPWSSREDKTTQDCCWYCLVAQSCLTLWLHGVWPARLLCPWDSPGKNTGVGCHFLLQGIFLT